MKYIIFVINYSIFCILLNTTIFAQDPNQETYITGVYQGKPLFIQNPYNPKSKEYCLEGIYVNKKLLKINYKTSAIIVNFEGLDLYAPVNIWINHRNAECKPVLLNPDAILFYSIFRFSSVLLSDTSLAWTTKGERGKGSFEIQTLITGIWRTQGEMDAEGVYVGASYVFFPKLNEGANKLRIRYNFPEDSHITHLFSHEIDYDFYPEPITLKPSSNNNRLYFTRPSLYKIYNGHREVVLSGKDFEVDIRALPKGQYVIYFDGREPRMFEKD